MKALFSGKISAALVVGIGWFAMQPLVASAINGTCSNCHTMHNSQDGVVVAAGGPLSQLLNANQCVGCHTGTNDATHKFYVLTTTADPGPSGTNTMLAGGNFYWVDDAVGAYDETKGHNVASVGGGSADSQHGDQPPGGVALTSQLTCAGSTGCHGNRADVSGNDMAAVAGSHHGNSNDAITAPTAGQPGTGFRFLDGIAGYEDSNRELPATLTTTQHNQYKGVDRALSTANDTSTISSLCAQCHGDFHNGAGEIASGGNNMGDPWVRHPTDYDMYHAIDKADYAGVSTTYSTLAPVASANVTAIRSTVMEADDDTSIVTCISCHRAHGSPYPDLLRWDYINGCIAGANNAACGCFNCHTTKDAG